MRIEFNTFGNLVLDFYRFMGREKFPKNETKELWFNKIRAYQETEINEAFEKMKDTLDSIPFNIPKAVKQAVFEVNRAKAAPTNRWKNYGPCEGCNGSGGYRLVIYDRSGTRYTPIQFCSMCDNWLNYANYPGECGRISSSELTASGLKFKPLNKVLMVSPVKAVGSGTADDLQEIANKSVKTMELI